jgi:GNAT superfamily N-acetyltransferase
MVMAGQVKIRSAQLQDSDRIAELCQQIGYTATSEEIRQRLKSVWQQQDGIVYVAQSNDYLIGWIHANICHLLVTHSLTLIFGLVVDEPYRCGGIGRMLVEKVEFWAKEKNCSGVLLRSNIIREQAHHFYRKIGYVEIKKSLTFYKEV